MSEESGVEAKIKASRNEKDIERLSDEFKELRTLVQDSNKEILDLISELKSDNDKQKGANKAVVYLVSTLIAVIGAAKSLGWLG